MDVLCHGKHLKVRRRVPPDRRAELLISYHLSLCLQKKNIFLLYIRNCVAEIVPEVDSQF